MEQTNFNLNYFLETNFIKISSKNLLSVCKYPIKMVEESRVETNDLQRSYQNALDLIKQAKEYEANGQEDQAKDAYYEAGGWAERTGFIWNLEFKGKRERAVAELEGIDSLLSSMPSQSDIEGLLPQIESGLDGRMKDIYASQEMKDRKNEQRLERYEQTEEEKYLLKRELDGQQTAQVLDVLRGIDGLELRYERVFDLSSQQRQDFEELIANQRKYIEDQITEGLTGSLDLPPETLASHDIRLDLRLYDNLTLHSLRRDDKFDIQSKNVVTVGLNFDGKTGLEIVEQGFSTMHGRDPNIPNYTLLGIQNSATVGKSPLPTGKSDTYQLSVYNPEVLFFNADKGSEIFNKAVERAHYMTSQLTAVK